MKRKSIEWWCSKNNNDVFKNISNRYFEHFVFTIDIRNKVVFHNKKFTASKTYPIFNVIYDENEFSHQYQFISFSFVLNRHDRYFSCITKMYIKYDCHAKHRIFLDDCWNLKKINICMVVYLKVRFSRNHCKKKRKKKTY